MSMAHFDCNAYHCPKEPLKMYEEENNSGFDSFHSKLQIQLSKLVECLSYMSVVQVGISLILSFLFLWDWPNIAQGVTNIKESRLSGFYNEVAPSLKVFAQLFGMALQAQTRIAIVNTILTAAGMWLLGIPGLLLLSLIVFLCRCAVRNTCDVGVSCCARCICHANVSHRFPGLHITVISATPARNNVQYGRDAPRTC
jgi:hypothetical protein